MPFRSVKQRRFLFAKHPKIARKWAKHYGWKVKRRRKAKKRGRTRK